MGNLLPCKPAGWLVLLVCVFSFLSPAALARQEVSCDSVHALHDEVRAIYLNDRDAALALIAEAKEHLESLDCPLAASDILKMDGVMHFRQGDYVEALQSMEAAIALAEAHEYEEGLANTWYNMAMVYRNMGENDRAAEYLFKCLAIDEKNGNEEGAAYCYQVIGDNFLDIGKTREAKIYFEKSLAIREKIGDPVTLAYAISSLGGFYYTQQKFDSALTYFQQSLALQTAAQNHRSMASELSNIGNCYLGLGRYEEAKRTYEVALIHEAKALDRYNYAGTLNALAFAHNRLKNYDSARMYARMSNDTASKYDYAHEVRNNLNLLHEVEFNDGNYKLAYDYLLQARELEDSLINEGHVVKISELKSNYEMQIKERELTGQKELLAQEEGYTRKLLIGLGVLLLVLLIIVVLLVIVVRIRKRLHEKNAEMQRVNMALAASEQELAASNKLKDQFFSIIAHDLKAPLINLHTLMFLVRSLPEVQRSPVVNEQVQILDEEVLKVSALLDNLLYWAINQQKGIVCQYEKVDVGKLLQETTELWQKYMESKALRLDLQLEGDLSITTDKQMLYFILRNLMSNAVKFTHPNGVISIQCRRVNGSLHLVVADQGIGMEPQQIENLFVADKVKQQDGTLREKGTGIGLLLVREFLHKLDGEISVKSVKGEGSEFTVGLPVQPPHAA